MSKPDPGWSWFERPASTVGAAGGKAGVDPDLALAFARCFRERDGRWALSHLRAITLERVMGPAATDAQLRHLEGQRQLVSYILALVERGRGCGPMAPETPAPEHVTKMETNDD